MIYGTYLFLNERIELGEPLSQDVVRILNRHVYPSIDIATIDFLERLEKTKASALRYALVFHGKQELGAEKELMMLRSSDKVSFKRTKIANPFYVEGRVRRKNVAMLGDKPSVKASMHQRMLQLLMLSNATGEVLAKYDLEDPYQDSLYAFQREYFKGESNMNMEQVLSFCRNVFSYLKIGWITINFMEDSPAAYFKVAHDSLGKKEEGDIGDLLDGLNDALAEEADDDFDENAPPVKEYMVDINALPDEPIQMAKLSLNIPVTWALNKVLLLHEISHYCVFMLPMTIEFHRDRDRYDETTFEQVFSSHGKVFNSVFAHLLSRFCYLDFDDVSQAMERHGAPLYPLEKFSESALYKFIHEDLN